MTPLSPLRSLEAAMEAASKRKPLRVAKVEPLYAQPTEKALRYEREHYAVSRLAQEAVEQQYDNHAHRRIRNKTPFRAVFHGEEEVAVLRTTAAVRRDNSTGVEVGGVGPLYHVSQGMMHESVNEDAALAMVRGWLAKANGLRDVNFDCAACHHPRGYHRHRPPTTPDCTECSCKSYAAPAMEAGE